jgi:hypothetical protein
MRRGVSFRGKAKDKLSKDTKRAYRKAYLTGEYDFNNDFIDEEPESEDEEDEVIMTAVLKKALRKIFKYKWLADTGAISHMTDDLNIYRSLLESCHRVIQVGGGKLYSTYKRVAEMVLADKSSALLLNCLLVLNLSISLFLTKRICSDQLIKGSFNSERICFYKNREKIIEVIV